MEFTFLYPVPENQRYSPDVFDSSIGERIPVNAEGRMIGYGTLLEAKVVQDGKAVEITVDLER